MVDSGYPASDWRTPQALLALRLCIEFFLDIGQISRGEGDLLEPLILTAILEANQAALRRDARLAQVYGDAATAAPDELRRPISINALARSLRLPFESVRRRVRGWVETGRCIQRPDGVYIPQAIVTSPAYVAVQLGRIERLGRFEGDLVRAGLLTPAQPGARGLAEAPRAADRVLGEYMLRASDRLIALAQGPVAGFVLAGLWAGNLEKVPPFHAMPLEEILAAAQSCSLAALARRIAAPAETVRRQLTALAGLGLAQRSGRGWLAAAPAKDREQLARMMAENHSDLRRLFARLRDLQRPGADGSGQGPGAAESASP